MPSRWRTDLTTLRMILILAPELEQRSLVLTITRVGTLMPCILAIHQAAISTGGSLIIGPDILCTACKAAEISGRVTFWYWLGRCCAHREAGTIMNSCLLRKFTPRLVRPARNGATATCYRSSPNESPFLSARDLRRCSSSDPLRTAGVPMACGLTEQTDLGRNGLGRARYRAVAA